MYTSENLSLFNSGYPRTVNFPCHNHVLIKVNMIFTIELKAQVVEEEPGFFRVENQRWNPDL